MKQCIKEANKEVFGWMLNITSRAWFQIGFYAIMFAFVAFEIWIGMEFLMQYHILIEINDVVVRNDNYSGWKMAAIGGVTVIVAVFTIIYAVSLETHCSKRRE